MTKLFSALALIVSVSAPQAALAAERTVTFAVENMTCASCPYIVKNAMAAVPGVTKVDVSYAEKTAIVTFDDAETTTDAIGAASTNAGYPARAAQRGS